MLESIVNTFKSFRDNIYYFFQCRRDAAFELVDSFLPIRLSHTVI